MKFPSTNGIDYRNRVLSAGSVLSIIAAAIGLSIESCPQILLSRANMASIENVGSSDGVLHT
ncbi:hypothetical protein BD410DRAFT_781805 [Rickenella mellea]|uniref:Uncharacterized protein n=1 Tax=Rickenella mellea TaxID=50990 RepID=A0A4Y7QM13_9AGAM|nr:hypothetical protein BD410DRAFT_781805 [Rickenella mellea]